MLQQIGARPIFSDLDEAEARLKEARRRGGSEEWQRVQAEFRKRNGPKARNDTPLFTRYAAVALYVSASPADFDYNYHHSPLLVVYAIADRKRGEEKARHRAYESLVRAKHPMAFMMLFMK